MVDVAGTREDLRADDYLYRRGHFDVADLPEPSGDILAGAGANVGGASVRLLAETSEILEGGRDHAGAEEPEARGGHDDSRLADPSATGDRGADERRVSTSGPRRLETGSKDDGAATSTPSGISRVQRPSHAPAPSKPGLSNANTAGT